MDSLDFLWVCFKQKTAYEIMSGDWSSDVCSSDLLKTSRPLQVVNSFNLLWIFLYALFVDDETKDLARWDSKHTLGGIQLHLILAQVIESLC